MKNNTGQQATFDRNSTDHRLGNSRLERLSGEQRTQLIKRANRHSRDLK